jgi:hypothetical protein
MLAPGSYRLQFSNDDISQEMNREISVAPGRPNEYVFTMPGFDPLKIAAEVEALP